MKAKMLAVGMVEGSVLKEDSSDDDLDALGNSDYEFDGGEAHASGPPPPPRATFAN